MTEEDIIRRFREGADRNLQTAKDLYTSGHYDWALFLGQLSLEKLLKSLVIRKTNKLPPFIHDLVKLASLTSISLSKEQEEQLIEITRYHVQARYDDIKYELYKKATKEYADIWFAHITSIYTFLCNQY